MRIVSAIIVFVTLQAAIVSTSAQSITPTVTVASAEQILEVVKTSTTPFTLVNIWATWCSPCIEEFPEIVKLAESYGDDSLSVIFVSLDFVDDLDLVRAFLLNQLWEKDSFIEYGSKDLVNNFIPEWTGTVPSTFIFDSEGSLVWQKEGKTTYSELETAISSSI